MPTYEFERITELTTRLDALDAAAAALGATNAATILAWFAAQVPSQLNFANPNFSGLLAALPAPAPHAGLW